MCVDSTGYIVKARHGQENTLYFTKSLRKMPDSKLFGRCTKEMSKFTYDAYVSHGTTARERDFVRKLSETLEQEPYNLRLFLPERDLIDTADKAAIAKVIKSRCKRMMIVMSEEYGLDGMAEFTLKTAFHLQGCLRNRLIIPVIMERCKVPPILSHVTLCDFSREDLHEWFYPRLACSLTPSVPERTTT